MKFFTGIAKYGVILGCLAASATAVTTTPAAATSPLQFTGKQTIAPGVVYRTFTYTGSAGISQGYELHADLTAPGVHVGLLHPPKVAESETVSAMARNQNAVGAVNGDFFNNTDEHAGIPPTFSSDGVEIAGGRALKGPVPDAQRFGPALVPGTSGTSVFGIGPNGTARFGNVHVTGSARTGRETLRLSGLNQFALPENSIGVYTTDWGSGSLTRPTCGNDTDRSAPCVSDVAEVVARAGIVRQVSRTIANDAVPPGTTVLIGRESGADALARLRPGQHISISYHLTATTGPQFRMAVGAEPIFRDGKALAGVDTKEIAPRTGIGIDQRGRAIDLVVVDGRSSASAGISIAEMTDLFAALGDDSAANVDGGGSSEMVALDQQSQALTVRNVPSDGSERPVANGVGIFLAR